MNVFLRLSTVLGTILLNTYWIVPAFAQDVSTEATQVQFTAELQEQILAINEQANAQIFAEFDRFQQLQDELNTLLLDPEISEDELKLKHQELQSIARTITVLEFENQLAIRRLLPPDLWLLYTQTLQQSVERIGNNSSED